VKEYWQDYAQFTPFISAPVLFFYGRSDWMVGPTHYKHARFPHMLLWPSAVGHVPFLENPADLAAPSTAIASASISEPYGLLIANKVQIGGE
ncbi:MAG TPA: hypothetical protein VN673_17655, partial [Clostridia bacterium]|nr:hypothetical protein [Clostridia bacterium]